MINLILMSFFKTLLFMAIGYITIGAVYSFVVFILAIYATLINKVHFSRFIYIGILVTVLIWPRSICNLIKSSIDEKYRQDCVNDFIDSGDVTYDDEET